ncbi:MAG: DUF4870 domain-containing protein [Pyrinomonadaceae bacterium]
MQNFGMTTYSGANQKSAIGMEGNIAAAISYPIGIIALILLFIEKDNKFVKFHAIQALLWGVAMTVVIIAGSIVLGIISALLGKIIGGLAGLLFSLGILGLCLISVGGLLYAAYKAYQGEAFKLPIVGNLAANFTK